jgi:hypothetical protein
MTENDSRQRVFSYCWNDGLLQKRNRILRSEARRRPVNLTAPLTNQLGPVRQDHDASPNASCARACFAR